MLDVDAEAGVEVVIFRPLVYNVMPELAGAIEVEGLIVDIGIVAGSKVLDAVMEVEFAASTSIPVPIHHCQ